MQIGIRFCAAAISALLALAPVSSAVAQADNTLFEDIQQLVAAGNAEDAEALARTLHSEAVQANGAQSMQAADAKLPLAYVWYNLGRFEESIELLEARVTITQAALGAESGAAARAESDLTSVLIGLASYLEKIGDYRGAEPIRQQIVQTYTRHRGIEDGETLEYQRMLAVNLKLQGRASEAEPIMKRTLDLMQQHLGESHVSTLIGYNDYGRILESLYRHKDAESYYRDAYELSAETAGKDDQETLVFAQNLGASLMYQQRFDEALPIIRDTLERRTRVLGPEHPHRLFSLSDLASVLTFAENADGAGAAYDELLPLVSKVFGAEHPHTMQIRNSYSVYLATLGGQEAKALSEARQSANLLRKRRNAIGLDAGGQRSLANFTETDRFYFENLLHALRQAGEIEAADRELLFAEAIGVIQESMEGPANFAILQRAAERAADEKGEEIGQLANERQLLSGEWAGLAKDRNGIISGDIIANVSTETKLEDIERRQDEIDQRIAEIDSRFQSDFPAFFDLVRPRPLDIVDAQNLFRQRNEAAVLIQPTPFGTHVIAISDGNLDWHVSQYTESDMSIFVRRLRWDVGAEVGVSFEEEELWLSEGEGAYPFDRQIAHFFYRQLIEPIEHVLDGKRHVYIVGGGVFSSLPFSMLVTEPPEGQDGNPQDLRDTAWLAEKYALVQLPSLQALQFIRKYKSARTGRQASGFAGFGDPVLAGEAMTRGGGAGRRAGANAVRAVPISEVFTTNPSKGALPVTDVAALRRLARLPGTARELEQMREVLGAPASSVRTGDAATEAAVKQADLSDASVLAFATHGLLAGEIGGATEPGLVFTPPIAASAEDDGLLSMSEIAALRLNAEWVILSACNTAAGDGKAGAPGLSGLTKAFFLAGANSLLATHWPVRDDIAALLTVRTIEIARSDPNISRAEAFQQAMREIRNDPRADSETDSWAHPNAWAPFTLIGDGL